MNNFNQTKHSKSVGRTRQKLKSLKVLMHVDDNYYRNTEKETMKNLEKSLEKDNRQQDPEVPEPDIILPGFEDLEVQCKLWKYYISKSEEISNKIEREQVNTWTRLMDDIKRQVKKKLSHNQGILSQLEILLKEKYQQVHLLFEEIKNEKALIIRSVSSRLKKNKLSNVQSVERNLKSRQNKEKIDSLRKEAQQINTQKKGIQHQIEKVNKEWRIFLVKLLQHSYYRQDGIQWILREMGEVNYKPKMQDFPSILDDTSKRCLIKEYLILKGSDTKKIAFDFIDSRALSKARAKSNAQIEQILKKKQLRDVYEGTKKYVLDWLREPELRNSAILPKIKNNHFIDDNWRINQKKRIQHVYEGEDLKKKVKSIMFGPKLQLQS